jgi:hypothetical protein
LLALEFLAAFFTSSDLADRWYRVQMSEACARSSMIGAPVSFQTTGMGGPIDTLSYVRLEDRSCAVQSIDRVELIASAE